MKNLAYVVLVLCASACTRSALHVNPDGGTGCSVYVDIQQCSTDSRCQWSECCGHGSCIGAGAATGLCPAVCTSCSGLDENSCKATAGCRADYCQECACSPTYVGCAVQGSPQTTCPVFECPVIQCGCAGLDEQSCIANKSCTPNYCACGSMSTFSGCTGPGDPVPLCELCQASCRASGDCTNSGGVCVAPGEQVCGGVCRAACTADTQCITGQVCDYGCNCGSTTGKTCVATCTASSCPTGQTCGADGHCAAIGCNTSGSCPANFDCVVPVDRGSPHCQRRACTGDTDCGAGAFCVDGACYASLGSCQFPPP
jgi:hypothetical protein